MRTLAITGEGGTMAGMADAAVAVPCANAQYVQETHLAVEHILCELVERSLFAEIHPSRERP
jgi:D-sedoheptulose 7-phosphate isomerase